MDRKDEDILDALVRNARTTYTALSNRLGITEAAVRKRVKKLEALGVIQRYTIIVDPTVLGFNAVALVGVDARPDALPRVFEQTKRFKNVKSIAFSSGDHMMMFEAWCRNQKELAAVVKHVKRIKGVTRVCPAILVKKREAAA